MSLDLTVTARPSPTAPQNRAAIGRYIETRRWRPRGLLVQTEWTELGQLPTAEARRDYLAAHELARVLLAEWTGVEPTRLRIRPSLEGPPTLIPTEGVATPHFDVSYVDGMALCVVAASRVGGFLGTFRQVLTDPGRVAWNSFTPREREELDKLPTHTRTERLLVQWTRREAVLRARGGGTAGRRPDVTSIRLTAEHVAAVAVVGAPVGHPPLKFGEAD